MPPNFTEEELLALIAAISERKDTLMSKFDSQISAKTKSIAW